jgi:hypothetical protein
MYSWFLLLYVAYMAIFVFFGSVIGLNMFRKNSYGESHWKLAGLLLGAAASCAACQRARAGVSSHPENRPSRVSDT